MRRLLQRPGALLPALMLPGLLLAAAGAPAQERTLPEPEPLGLPAAADPPAPGQLPLDLSALVGLTLSEALARFGAPLRVFAARGEESWQDDVVFFYAGHLYLYWYQERVWQARLDENHPGGFLADRRLSMGARREEVLGLLGPPMRELGGSLVYHLEDRGYPVRLRLYFREGLLVDAYCYRGDL
jgi:hypothetical protein